MNEKFFHPVSVITKHPHPFTSPDYTDPAGSIEDNSSFTYFIHEIDHAFNGLPYHLLDLGCAGGQFVVDIYNKGAPWLAIGIEGGNVLGMTEDFEPRHHETGILHRPRGAENWKLYKDKCLFSADVSKPFDVLDGSGNLIKFNMVTAWEFFEHPLPEEVPGIMENIVKHMHPGSVFMGTINACLEGVVGHHRCAKSREWWDNMFISYGFKIIHYPFRTSPRTNMSFLEELVHRHENKLEVGWTPDRRLVDQEVSPLNLNQYTVCYEFKE